MNLDNERPLIETLGEALSMPRTGCPWRDVDGMLRAARLRPTRQRMSLAWMLFGKGDRHLTAEMLYADATRAKVQVSLATVYNTLNQLTQAGLLKRVSVDGDRAYFDTDVSSHCHFFLEDQKLLVDADDPAVEFDSGVPIPHGFELIRTDIVIRLRRR